MILISVLLSSMAWAAECDNFSGRSQKIELANEKINSHVNSILEEVASYHNKRTPTASCDPKAMLVDLERKLGRNFPDIYGRFLWDSPPVAGPREFKDFPFRGKYRNSYSPTFVPSYRVQVAGKPFLIGLDKVDHFFSHGFRYWKFIQDSPKKKDVALMEALKMGENQENSIWGLKSWGIKSYGDLAANYLGIAFWSNVLEGSSPHFVCLAGKYQLKRRFQFEEYFDASVDEAINCSSFSDTETMQEMVRTEERLGHRCVAEKSYCQDLVRRYPQDIGEKILHPLCRGKEHSRVEEPPPIQTDDLINAALALGSGGENLVDMFFDMEKWKVTLEQAINRLRSLR